MANESVFNQFCKYVDETIFSDEKRGEVVAFVVDQNFIDDFCREFKTTEEKLMTSAMYSLHSAAYNAFLAKGMIAIQVFAATKRANSDGITERNYRDRLSELIFYNTGELQRWMSDYQDQMWATFYRWCDCNDFLVSRKCKPGYGYGRYVQYPLQEALRVFTTEALLNFARAFVDNGLTPEDDYACNTFWEIVTWRQLASYIDSENARRIYYDPKFTDDAKQQIYNFFLRWDGEYRTANYSESKKRVSTSGNILYLTDDYDSFEIRDASQKLLSSYSAASTQYHMITNTKNRIPKRYSGIFIFKRNADYEIWEEVRYLEEGETGIAVLFPQESNMAYAFRNCPVLVTMPRLKIVRLSQETGPSIYFTEKKTCYLEGGLKIGKNQYLLGAAPILVREVATSARIDHEPLKDEGERVNLNFLDSGPHIISIPGKKSIHFELIASNPFEPEWSIKNHKWEVVRSSAIWRDSQKEDGVSGMDLMSICQSKYLDREVISPTQAWSKLFMGDTPKSNNTVIRTLKGIRDHGKL